MSDSFYIMEKATISQEILLVFGFKFAYVYADRFFYISFGLLQLLEFNHFTRFSTVLLVSSMEYLILKFTSIGRSSHLTRYELGSCTVFFFQAYAKLNGSYESLKGKSSILPFLCNSY
jgi:hypothetical protein